MPQTAAALRTALTGRNLNETRNVAGLGQVVTLELVFEGVTFTPEDLFDALAAKYGAAAALTTAMAGANNDLTFTARRAAGPGLQGNLITVALVDPAANSQALAVTVVGNAISVALATSGGGAITSTADNVRDAVNKDTAASALVRAERAAANDGTGVVTALAVTALAGGDSKVTSDLDTTSSGRYRWRVRA